MKSKIKKEVTITLELNRYESEWLKSFVQNGKVLPDQEEQESKDICKKLWDALSYGDGE